MGLTVLAIGVVVRLSDEPASEPGAVPIEVVCFAETGTDGAPLRLERRSLFAEIAGDGDPTSELLSAAHEQRELNLGGLLGDMRRAGEDVTRFEFFSAPFRIEFADELRKRLRGRWSDREPVRRPAPPPSE